MTVVYAATALLFNSMKPRLRQALISGLAFGLALLAGMILSQFIAGSIDAARFLSGDQARRLLLGVLLAFAIAASGGFLAGFAGGWTLPVVGQAKGRWGYAWPSGVVFGAGYGILVFPVILIIAILSFYDIASIPAIIFSLVFGIVGLIFGLIVGGILATWALRRVYGPGAWGGAVGFGLGGVGLGYGLWRYLLSVNMGSLETGLLNWLLFGIFIFGGLGGASLGLVFLRAATRVDTRSLWVHKLTPKGWLRRMIIFGLLLLVLALMIRPVLAGLRSMFTPVDAQLSPVLDLKTTGTHWLDAWPLASSNDRQPALATDGANKLLAGWIANNDVTLVAAEWSLDDRQAVWRAPVLVAGGPGGTRSHVQLAVTQDGSAQVAWVEQNDAGSAAIMTSYCAAGSCSAPLSVSSTVTGACAGEMGQLNQFPTLAMGPGGTLMLVWENGSGILPYATWPLGKFAEDAASGCIASAATERGSRPRVKADETGAFYLVYETDAEEIRYRRYIGGEWDAKAQLIGNGNWPELYLDQRNDLHAAWCGDGQISYWQDGATAAVAPTACTGRPALALDENSQVHLLWASEQISDVNGRITPTSVILESMADAAGWTPAAIVAANQSGAGPQMVAAGDGSLHMLWNEADELRYAAQLQYSCRGDDLSRLGQIVYDIGRQERYIPPEDPLPYCDNQYDRLIFTPNPDPAFSEQTPTENGAFDKVAELITDANYEVLYSTMWYDDATDHDSPGAVIADAVADLYSKVRDNPQQYPRGMTVRILLDNPPEMARGETTGQLWSLLGDLRHAGVEKMIDRQIGWRLEVADYRGSVPHSHVKTVIIDGQTAVAAGFNTTYNHFALDHPSGQGKGRFDMGLQITGPAAQAALRMFDDMWRGASQRSCRNFNPPFSIPWQTTCFEQTATADHVPEVLKFYLPGGSSHAFSLYRSRVHDAADKQTAAALRAAQESIDIIQVNFTLELICNLNIVFDVCPAGISPVYMPALIAAAENGAKIRIIIKPSPFEGIENTVAIDALSATLRDLGLEEQFEVRFYEQDMHPKVALIDNQLLIVGSQNFHYSAYGTGAGLNEYSFAVDDPQAVEDFSRAFEFIWQESVPAGG